MSVAGVVDEIERDTMFFDESGGGVTFSGGEPLAQPEFLVAALARCGARGIHRAVDTSGYAPRDVLLRVAEQTDLFLYDLKPAHAASRLAQAGVEMGVIHDNLRALCETGAAIQLRIPVIPGITDTAEALDALKRLVASLPRELPLKLLPYHGAAMDKYPRFGMTPTLRDTQEPTVEEIAECRMKIRRPAPVATRR